MGSKGLGEQATIVGVAWIIFRKQYIWTKTTEPFCSRIYS